MRRAILLYVYTSFQASFHRTYRYTRGAITPHAVAPRQSPNVHTVVQQHCCCCVATLNLSYTTSRDRCRLLIVGLSTDPTATNAVAVFPRTSTWCDSVGDGSVLQGPAARKGTSRMQFPSSLQTRTTKPTAVSPSRTPKPASRFNYDGTRSPLGLLPICTGSRNHTAQPLNQAIHPTQKSPWSQHTLKRAWIKTTPTLFKPGARYGPHERLQGRPGFHCTAFRPCPARCNSGKTSCLG